MSDLHQQLESTLGNTYTIEEMERAVKERDSTVVGIPTFCGFDPLLNDPRFERLVAELKFPLWSLVVGEERKLRFVAPRLGLRPSVVSQRAARALPDE